MHENVLNMFASHGLEILKRSVLLVLYEETDAVDEDDSSYIPHGRILKQGEIREILGFPYVRFPSGNTNSLIQGVLDYLKQDRHAHHYSPGWAITTAGVSVIED